MFSGNCAVNVDVVLFTRIGLGINVGDYFQVGGILSEYTILALKFDNQFPVFQCWLGFGNRIFFGVRIGIVEENFFFGGVPGGMLNHSGVDLMILGGKIVFGKIIEMKNGRIEWSVGIIENISFFLVVFDFG